MSKEEYKLDALQYKRERELLKTIEHLLLSCNPTIVEFDGVLYQPLPDIDKPILLCSHAFLRKQSETFKTHKIFEVQIDFSLIEKKDG